MHHNKIMIDLPIKLILQLQYCHWRSQKFWLRVGVKWKYFVTLFWWCFSMT